MPRERTVIIKFRCPKRIAKFLENLTVEVRKHTGYNPREFTISHLLRMITEYFFMAYTLGQWKKPLPELRKEFMSFLRGFKKPKRRKRKR